ncbi:MAG: GHKL domain-containing protein, partial [Peptococcaceae bacterium]|nr:GHKL domain-containing protein [Peptococcaceae bacterium]
DNAIEACDRLPPQAEKRIDLLLMEETETLYCKITNTAPLRHSSDFTTSKIDPTNHGFGLSNIREALETYDVTLNIAQNGTLFTLEFLLFL